MFDEPDADPRAGDRLPGRVDHRPGDPAGRLEDHGIEGLRIRPASGARADIARMVDRDAGADPFGQHQGEPPRVVGGGRGDQLIGLRGHEVDRLINRIREAADPDLDPGDRLAAIVHDRAFDAMGQGQ